jgi:hypothetical protein
VVDDNVGKIELELKYESRDVEAELRSGIRAAFVDRKRGVVE